MKAKTERIICENLNFIECYPRDLIERIAMREERTFKHQEGNHKYKYAYRLKRLGMTSKQIGKLCGWARSYTATAIRRGEYYEAKTRA